MIEIILYVNDQKISRDFYQKILKKKPILDVDGMTEFLLNENCKLGLMPYKGIKKLLGDSIKDPANANGIPRAELYIIVNNLEESFDIALKAGAKLLSPIMDRDWGAQVCYFADPDCHIIAFAKKIT